MKRIFFFLCTCLLSLLVFADEVATITISGTVTANTTIKDSQGNSWTFVADPAGNLAGESGCIKLGSNSKNAQSLSFETTAYADKWVRQIELDGYSNESYGLKQVYPCLYIHDSLIVKGESMYGSSRITRTLTNPNKVMGRIRFTMERQTAAQKAIYFYSARITFSDLPQEVNSITISHDTLTLKELTSDLLTATVDPSSVLVTWETLDESVATVTDGVVRGENVGTTSVVAHAGELTDTCVIVVTKDESITARSFQIVFNSSDKQSDQSFTHLDELILVGKQYVQSFEQSGNVQLIAGGGGVKLASSKSQGALTLHLKQEPTMAIDSVQVFAKQYSDKDNSVSFTLNNISQSITKDLKGYTFPLDGRDIVMTAKSDKRTAISKIVVYYREYEIVPPTTLFLDQDSIVLEKGQQILLSATVFPDNTTERGVVWTLSDETVVEWQSADKTITLTGRQITTKPMLLICTSVYDDHLADTCYVTVVDRTLHEPVYNRMTALSDLKNGDQMMFGRHAEERLMGTYSSGNNIEALEGIFSDDKSQVEEQSACVYTLEIIRKGVYAFRDAQGRYLCYNPSAGNANNIQSSSILNDYAQWTCTNVAESGMCDWASLGMPSRYIQYNTNANLFACYTGYGNVCLYYRHDENAGSITLDPESVEWETRLQDSAAHFEAQVAVVAEHLAMEMEGGVDNDLLHLSSATLPAEGDTLSVVFDVHSLAITASDTTICAHLTLTGIDLNTNIQEKILPITIHLLREPRKIVPVSITTVLSDSIRQMGGVHMQNSTKEIAGKDTFLLDTLTVLYVSDYEFVVSDKTGCLAITGRQRETLKQGDRITGVRGRLMGAYKRYYFQLIEATLQVEDSVEVVPETATTVPVYPTDMSRYLRFDSVRISGSTIVLPDESRLAVVDNYGIHLPADTEPFYRVEGIASVKGKQIQLILTDAAIDPNFQRPVSSIRVTPQHLLLMSGDEASVEATVYPLGENPVGAYNRNVLWTTDNTDIIRLESNGSFTALQAGVAHVIATAEDQTKGVFSDTCTVEVKAVELMLPKGTKIYELVTDVAMLHDGDTILLINRANRVTMGLPRSKESSTKTSYYFDAVDSVNLYNAQCWATCSLTPNELRLVENAGQWTLLTNGNAIGMTQAVNNNLHADGTGDTLWNISVYDSVARITSAGNSSWSIQYNAMKEESGGHRFSNYKSAQAPLSIYRYNHRHTPEHVAATDLLLNRDTLRLHTGETTQLQALVFPASADEEEKEVLWSVLEDRSGISVTDGTVFVSAAGEYDVIATLAHHLEVSDTCHVVATDSVHVSSVEIQIAGSPTTEYTLKEQQSVQLTAVLTPASADEQTIVWTSSNEKCVQISAEGLLTALYPGTAIVTATSPDRGVKAELQVTVTEIYVRQPMIMCASRVRFDTITYYGLPLSDSKTLEVKVQKLTAPVVASLSKQQFVLDADTLDRNEGGVLTLSYNVSAPGTYRDTLILASIGADTVRVPVAVQVLPAMTIAEFVASEEVRSTKDYMTIRFLNPVTVTMQSGDNLYVRDTTGSLLICGAVETYANGTILYGVQGALSFVRYNPHLQMTALITSAEGTVQQADTLTHYPEYADISNWVVLPKVQFTKSDSIFSRKVHYVSLDGQLLDVFSSLVDTVWYVATDADYEVSGMIQLYGQDHYQLLLLSVTPLSEPCLNIAPAIAFPEAEVRKGESVSGALSVPFESCLLQRIELEYDTTNIFHAEVVDNTLQLTYQTAEADVYQDTVVLRGIPVYDWHTAPVVEIAVSAVITEAESGWKDVLNTSSADYVIKFVRNGNIYLLRNGICYTILGSPVYP